MVLSCFLVISVSYAPFNCKGYSYTLFSSQVVLMYISIKDKKKISKQYEKSARNQKYDTLNKILQ